MGKFEIKVIPKSRHQKLEIRGNSLKIWLQSPPEGGRANEELKRILAKNLKNSPLEIEIVSGFSSRNKRVDILGVTLKDLKNSLI